jgi:hypothetical protein
MNHVEVDLLQTVLDAHKSRSRKPKPKRGSSLLPEGVDLGAFRSESVGDG